MNKIIRGGAGITLGAVALVITAPWSASAAGPQKLPPIACNSGTATALSHAPTQTSVEAIPHIEHSFPVAVPYCHHFNPTASPPTAG